MLIPSILSRMKKPCQRTRVRVKRREVGTFTQIAVGASQREILQSVQPTVLPGHDMLEMESGE